MHWRIFSKTYRSYSLPGLHDLECHGFKDQGHRQQFLKMHFSGGSILLVSDSPS